MDYVEPSDEPLDRGFSGSVVKEVLRSKKRQSEEEIPLQSLIKSENEHIAIPIRKKWIYRPITIAVCAIFIIIFATASIAAVVFFRRKDVHNHSGTLLIAREKSILRQNLSSLADSEKILTTNNSLIYSIAYDCKEQRIVWSTQSKEDDEIWTAPLHDTNRKIIVGKQGKRSKYTSLKIAVDYLSRNVYYTDMQNNKIGVINLNSAYNKTIINILKPNSLALDLKNRHLFFSTAYDYVIHRADLDGSNREIFVESEIQVPRELVVLDQRRELCWGDFHRHELSCIGLDQRNRRLVYSNLEDADYLTAQNEERFYWIENTYSDKVYSGSILGEDYTSFQVSGSGYIGSGYIRGLAVLPENCSTVETECAVYNGGCPYLCLPKTGGGVSCVCPDDSDNLNGCRNDVHNLSGTLMIAKGSSIIRQNLSSLGDSQEILEMNNTVTETVIFDIAYDCKEERIVCWTSTREGDRREIWTAPLIGTKWKLIATQQRGSAFNEIAVDYSSGNVYYTDYSKNVIGVINLNSTYNKTLIYIRNPISLALDLKNRHLFVSALPPLDSPLPPMILRTDLDGSNRKTFVETEIQYPSGFVILDQRYELCWIDNELYELSCIGLDQRNRRLVYSNLKKPVYLTAHNEERFYWTEFSSYKVYSVSIFGEDYMSFVPGGSGISSRGLAVLPENCITVETECAVNNGGCPYLCLPKTGGGVSCVCPDDSDNLNSCTQSTG